MLALLIRKRGFAGRNLGDISIVARVLDWTIFYGPVFCRENNIIGKTSTIISMDWL